MTLARLQIAKAKIHRFLNAQPQRNFTQLELTALLAPQRETWNLSDYTASEIVEFLLQNSRLQKKILAFPSKKEVRFEWGNVPLTQSLMALKPEGYLSHHSALHIHKLTHQAPQTYYLNREQIERPQTGTLNQASIDRAFRRPPRRSRTIAQVDHMQVCLVNGKQTGNLGVVTGEFAYGGDVGPLRVTNLHRTLIDAVVRPAYCGGIDGVLAAYELARSMTSISKLVGMLVDLDYVYPYHQAIGYCLEQAGHSSASLRPLRRLPRKFDFYLAHHTGEFAYIEAWRLFIPLTHKSGVGGSPAATAPPAMR